MSDLDGFKDLKKKLEQLEDVPFTKFFRSGMTGGGNVVKKEAVRRIPRGRLPHKTYKGRIVGAGFASRNVIVRTKIYKRKGIAVTQIGVKREAFYATQFIELGTRKMRARPWLVPAFESAQGQAFSRIYTQMEKRLKKIAK